MDRRTVTLIKGDGIGPEIADALLEIFQAAGAPIDWEEAEAGLTCVEKYGNGLPPETLESIKRNKIAIKGPTTTPIGGGHKSVNVTIRKTLDLFANVRPSKSLPGIPTRYENVDLILVRENIEDTYGGIEHWQSPDVAQCLRLITRPGSMAIMKYAFEMARKLGRKKVTCVHKANIQKITDGLFLECFRAVAEQYPNIEATDILIDNACMQLVSKPEQFDVLVLPNLFGDLVSDLCAGLVGGLGIASGANIGNEIAVFEAVHGSAPDIAGQGVANPTALLLSGVQMLHHLGLHSHAERIETALRLALVSGIKTRDLGGHATTKDFTRFAINALPKSDNAPDRDYRDLTDASPEVETIAVSAQTQDWKLVGSDVFVRSQDLPQLPEQIGKFKLSMISNRGTKVYPGETPDILMVDIFRCRFMSTESVTDDDVMSLLTAVSNHYPWSHVEKLHEMNGAPMFSKAQGE